MDTDAVLQALRAKAEDLRDRLLTRVDANLSGDVLEIRSGALKASIFADLTFDAGRIAIDAGSHDVPYAPIQEYGGQTAPHAIVAVKAQALALAFAGVGVGGTRFARRVAHPGSAIPARSFLGSALDGLREEITTGLKDVILSALAAH